ncbi:unnamed protein product [Leptidea sinapis]|uniref:Homeobox domain-containing protein n=1 Tax=Leptidea sinapis TaxID=189913 RepID=A0A5E4R4G7_9NEOP|nr:unnamed protein product [Leptidea sinapis]
MDLSTPPSNSKCTSDFSIERILSDSCSREESGESPSWLCCTSACRSRRSGRHARVPFTAAQAAALEAAYARAPYLAPPALKALAAALQLRDDRIKIWFQNRRARERREKCSTVIPPQAIALPSTKPILNNTWINPQYYTEGTIQGTFVEPSFQPSHVSGGDRLLSDDSNDGRCETPLDVESID